MRSRFLGARDPRNSGGAGSPCPGSSCAPSSNNPGVDGPFAATTTIGRPPPKVGGAREELVLKIKDELAVLESEGILALNETSPTAQAPRSPVEKIALFLDLFGTRRSVFPKRWGEKQNRQERLFA